MRRLIKNHSGSALVTVIVVIAFISILATTLLYVSGVNYQMKVADSKTKESFYETEIPIDTIRADLIRMVSDTMENKVYTPMMYSLGNCYDTQEVQVTYENMILDALQQEILTYVGGNATTTGVTVERESRQIRIKGIVVKQTINDYTTEIHTDIVVVPPEIDWPWSRAAKSLSDLPSPSPSASALPGDGEINYYKCVYYENWEKK